MKSHYGATLKGIVLGALGMYYLDPRRGAARRARVKNKLAKIGNQCAIALEREGRNVINELIGTAYEATAFLRGCSTADEKLGQRVRSNIGRYVSHIGAIEVDANNGRVTLCGPILEREVAPLLNAVRSVRGVIEVINELEPHSSAEGVPALQGGKEPRAPEINRSKWSPATRMVVGGLGMQIVRRPRRGLLGKALWMTGAASLLRAATNSEFQKLSVFNGNGRDPGRDLRERSGADQLT